MLACAAASCVPPAFAQEPSSNQATLNFVGADIDAVIKAIGHYTHTTFVIDPRVKGTINLVSEKPVSKSEALQMLTSALRLHGYAVVKVDGFSKVVPEADAKLQAGPVRSGAVRGDQIATQIFHLNYESAAGLVPVLRPLISPNNTINADPSNNSLVITDYADNLKRLGRIIASLDAPSSSDLDVVPVRYAVASDIASMVNRLLETGTPARGAGNAAGGAGVEVLADPRINSVIIRAQSAARANLAKSLVAKLDQPTAEPGNVHVIYLRNADAIKLAQTLRAVVSADTSTPERGNQGNQPQSAQGSMIGNNANQQEQLGGAPLKQASASSQQTLPSGGSAGFIQADASTNSLIITASEPVYRNLRNVIDKLDARRAQVYIESLIVEVSADKAAQLGVQWLGLTGDSTSSYRLGGGTAFSSGGNNIATLATQNGQVLPGNGLSIGLFRQINGNLTLGAIAHALETEDNANILSIPNLITLDNEEARIIVGQNVPFITGQYTTTASGASNPFQTIERHDIGLALRVKPQISEGGTIKLQIYQETSAIQDQSNTAGIITSKRSIESNVLVDDGQIVVLGGLIQDQMTDGTEKVPGLGDLPLLGGLFRYQTRQHKKTNLMVFLRPVVLRSSEESTNISADRYDFIRGVQIHDRPVHKVLMPDATVPVLPPLQNGRPAGNGELFNRALPQPTVPQAVPPAPAPVPAPVPETPNPALQPPQNPTD